MAGVDKLQASFDTTRVVREGIKNADKIDDKNLKLNNQQQSIKADIKPKEGDKNNFLGVELVKNKLEQIVGDKDSKNLLGLLDKGKLKSKLEGAGFENNPKLADAVKSLEKGDVNQAAKLLIDGLSTQDKKNNKGVTELAKENKKIEVPKKDDKNDGSKLLVEAAPKKGSVQEDLAKISQQIQETRNKLKSNEEKAGAGIA